MHLMDDVNVRIFIAMMGLLTCHCVIISLRKSMQVEWSERADTLACL